MTDDRPQEPSFWEDEAQGQTAVLNGAELYYEWQPGEGTQLPLVFLHGGPGYQSASFRELFGDKLKEWSGGSLLLDQRGSGRSAPLEDTEQGDELDLNLLVDDLEALREHLDIEQIIPLGHGFGALVALEYARRFPQHTKRVVAVNPWLHFPGLALTLLAEASALKGQELQDPADDVREQTPEGAYPAVGSARIQAAFELLNARDLLNTLQFVSPQSRMQLEFIDAEQALPSRAEVGEALVYQGMWEFEYPAFLEEIRRPVSVIAGVHDRTSYPEQTDWLVDLGGAELTVLDAGHYPWLDDEEAFAEALWDALR
ncbi:alpha/beta fold hydrolase [Deinococcus radiophilus]|uniref:Alpha/beta hydrolase n=2 Tax=Deinococcus radiophilus TaxID=32062 RepID=A0A3S0IC43_9DEIO|nr:alpha/beta hydrolase [Deinococcus radiophilus]RTR30268.1 alpha/beta hydrolase [Deinococcus radiophilus]